MSPQTAEERVQSLTVYSSRRHLSLSIFTAPSPSRLPPLSGRTEFTSSCISPKQTDGYTQRPRRAHTHKTKWLLLLCHFVYLVLLDTEAFSVHCFSFFFPLFFPVPLLTFNFIIYSPLFTCSHFPQIISSFLVKDDTEIRISPADASLSPWVKSLWNYITLPPYHRKWTRMWGIDFLSALWGADGSEVKTKSTVVDKYSHHNSGSFPLAG